MTYQNFIKLLRFYALGSSADDQNLSDGDIVVLANIYKDEFAREITKTNEDTFGMVYFKNLEAGRREYPIPVNLLNNLKYLEAMLDGSTYSVMKQLDLTQYQRATTETDIRNAMTGKAPRFDIFRNSIWLYTADPIIAVENGLLLWCLIYPADITEAMLSTSVDMATPPTTTSHGIPRQFHELLARRCSIAYKQAQERPIALTEKELVFESDFQKALNSMTNMDLNNSVTIGFPEDNGQDY